MRIMIELYPHQKEALDHSKGLNRVAYFYDMGLGKTFIGSEKMKDLGARTNLLICQKSKIKDWIEHFRQYPEYVRVDLTTKGGVDTLVEWTREAPIIGFINYELAWRREELLKLENFTLMLDESSLIQNDKAKQTKFILKMNPTNVILLSGTPCSGKYENLWSQAQLLGWNIKKSVYESQFVNFELLYLGPRKVRVVAKKEPYKNIERLKSKLRERGAVFKKTEEVLDLPEQRFIEVKCQSTPAYKRFLKDKVVTIDGIDLIGDTTLTARLYARMLASQYNPNKLERLKELIESTNDRLIVFYNFTEELEKIKTVTGDRPLSIVNGKTKDLFNYEQYEDSITIVQYQAGAKGLNLQKSNKIIYFSPTEKCEDWMQSIKRIHRIGQKTTCIYYKLITERTVDEKIYKALERGEDYTNELFKEELKNG